MGASGANEVVLDVLRTEGVRLTFGAPGGALCSSDDVRHIPSLQQAVAVGMADGWAQSAGRPAVVHVHGEAGLGNAIGNLSSAQANQSPMLVIVEQSHDDLHRLASAVSRVHSVRTAGELATILRRAFHDSRSTPPGPVCVSVPADVFDDAVDHAPARRSAIDRHPVAGDLDALAMLLTRAPAGKVAIVVGDEVAAADAVEEVVLLAEMLGAPVHGAPLHASAVFPPRHACWAGMLVPAASAVNAALGRYDCVLQIGGRALMAYPYTPGSSVPPATDLLHLSADPHQLGRSHPTRWASAGDPKASVAALLPLVAARSSAARVADAASFIALQAPRRAAAIERVDTGARARYDAAPMHPMAAVHAVLGALPLGPLVVDEVLTASVFVRGLHHDPVPGRYFFNRGSGLGWGMPAAVGVSLGRDHAPVVCFVGDGAAMYSPQAMWSAAREQTPVVFTVVNNRGYLTLQNHMREMAGASAGTGRFTGTDLSSPAVDFVALAASMGVAASRVTRASDAGDAMRAALETGRPHLLELLVTAG
jgi:benzoylformate decarboxylase